MTTYKSDALLDTIEAFIDSCPECEGLNLEFEPRQTGENETVRMQHIIIDGEKYLVVVKRVGG